MEFWSDTDTGGCLIVAGGPPLPAGGLICTRLQPKFEARRSAAVASSRLRVSLFLLDLTGGQPVLKSIGIGAARAMLRAIREPYHKFAVLDGSEFQYAF
jgi:hypothetical protein